MDTNTATDQNQNLPAVTSDNLPSPVETLEFNPQGFNEVIAAIAHAETYKPAEMEAVRVDAVYFKPEKAGEEFTLMIAGYSWGTSEFGEGLIPVINLYNVEKREFLYGKQKALVGKCMEAKLPRGQMVKITYLGKTKGKKFSYEDFKIEALVPKKAEPKAEETEPEATAKSGKK